MEIEDQAMGEKKHDKHPDPIIEYLKFTKKQNMPPHKIAFQKVMKDKDRQEEESDEDDVAYDLKGVLFTQQFAEAFS